MEDGNNDVLFRAERAVNTMISCGLEHSAKDVINLIRYTKTLDKNQKAFVSLTLRQQRLLKTQRSFIDLCYKTMTRKQRRTILKKVKEGDNA